MSFGIKLLIYKTFYLNYTNLKLYKNEYMKYIGKAYSDLLTQLHKIYVIIIMQISFDDNIIFRIFCKTK